MVAIALVSCQTVDLTPLEKRVSELETIVHNLQEISLTGDYVTDIQPLTENGKIAGYFPNANKVDENDLGMYMLGAKHQSAEEIGGALND